MAKNRRPSKDDGCCSVHFLKYLLFIFNFLFYIAGLAILGIGIWTLFWKMDYVVLLPSRTYLIITYILLGAGVAVLLTGIVGCCGVLKESRCCLLTFTFLLLIIFLVEAVGGVMAYVCSDKIGSELESSLEETFSTRFFANDSAVDTATANLHRNHHCCGAVDFQDWRNSAWHSTVNAPGKLTLRVPDFCCVSESLNCGKRDHPSNIYYEGCLRALEADIRKHEVIIGAVALGVSAIQIFGMVISCCLYSKLREFQDFKRWKEDRSAYY